MPDPKLHVVFVHGWSVTHTDTYGELPRRLAKEAEGRGFELSVRDLWLGRYISFHDEVRLEDVSRAMEAAVRRDLADLLEAGERFVVITHSTGGPVARDWWLRFYAEPRQAERCPMSHLVMLAPANFGSALAQLGKSRVSRLKSWFQDVEPGQGVLDWLELGSPEAWELNHKWITGRYGVPSAENVFPFVLTGQTIDRAFYDNLNSYTGELGSDGVVRVAAANLQSTYLKLQQQPLAEGSTPKKQDAGSPLEIKGRVRHSADAPLRIIAGASHSGKKLGVMRSVDEAKDAQHGRELVQAVFDCVSVKTTAQYAALEQRFAEETAAVQAAELVEIQDRLLRDRTFIHDRATQVIFRVTDTEGHAVTDFDLVLTGANDDPNLLPAGFFRDRQRNSRSRNTLTYYFNHDVMAGCPPVVHGGRQVREAQPGIAELGLRILPRPDEGFVRYLPASIRASEKIFEAILRANRTTLVDIVLQRVVSEGVFRLGRGARQVDFEDTKPGGSIR